MEDFYSKETLEMRDTIFGIIYERNEKSLRSNASKDNIALLIETSFVRIGQGKPGYLDGITTKENKDYLSVNPEGMRFLESLGETFYLNTKAKKRLEIITKDNDIDYGCKVVSKNHKKVSFAVQNIYDVNNPLNAPQFEDLFGSREELQTNRNGMPTSDTWTMTMNTVRNGYFK